MNKLQIPTAGRIVHYKLTEADAKTINGMVSDARTRERKHIGNDAKAGDVLPMLIIRAWGDTPESSVNGQVFLDGIGTLWITSRSVGDQPGSWAWPEHVAPAKTSKDVQSNPPGTEDFKEDLAESRVNEAKPTRAKKPKKS